MDGGAEAAVARRRAGSSLEPGAPASRSPAGYHRLFAHGSYRCSSIVSLFFLLFGAAAVQNSAIAWVSHYHPRHHAHTDSDEDPYDVRRGLWWAHMGWVLHDDTADHDYRNVPHLLGNRLIALQHRWYCTSRTRHGGSRASGDRDGMGRPTGGRAVGWLRSTRRAISRDICHQLDRPPVWSPAVFQPECWRVTTRWSHC